MKTNTQIISEFLEEQRQFKGISIYRLSKDLGVSGSNLGRVFSGKNSLSANLFLLLCSKLQFDANQFEELINLLEKNHTDNFEK
jgi:transcriptional regulator with XRE-family HTH domain